MYGCTGSSLQGANIFSLSSSKLAWLSLSIWDLSSPTRDRTGTPCRFLATGPPWKSPRVEFYSSVNSN